MLKRCLIVLMLTASQLSAETTMTTKDPVKKTLSQKQQIALYFTIIVSNSVAGTIFARYLPCRNRGAVAKILLLVTAFGCGMVLTTLENNLFEEYFLGATEASETLQKTIIID